MAISTPLDHKIMEIFGDLAIDKQAVRELKIREARTITSFVEEWLVSRHSQPGRSQEEIYSDITSFMRRHLPAKAERESIKYQLNRGEAMVLLDRFEVRVDLSKGLNLLTIPCLDESHAQVSDTVLDSCPGLLCGGQWGAGRLQMRQEPKRNVLELIEFRPMESGQVRLIDMVNARREFNTSEWMALLLRTMGCEPTAYTENEQRQILLRLVPLMQKNINMLELAPKGTGKSFIYSNLSRYVWLNSGGTLTRAQLFKNMRTREEGLLARFDVLVLDEGQSINFQGADDIHAQFKGYLESGQFSVGDSKVTSECGLMVLANIDIDHDRRPLRSDYIKHLPEMFHDDALLDRFHGIIPGWRIPRFTSEHAARGPGLKADGFGEYAHQIRIASAREFPFGEIPVLHGDIRDQKAVERIARSLSRLFMLNPDDADYQSFVLEPAKELRQRVRSQLAAINPREFHPDLQIRVS